ncbi:uncharacterized protein J3D65DRAFT_612296 [Phyllosticta citribraziliensis]|uniref:Uncharacterized protein n=1 Tax=Phyllosticta citribraziliensis TaxID=989973 RepID=A0ABR1M345_9PEZI
MIHACKALRHFSYVASPPAPSVQPHQAPIIIVLSPNDFAPHHGTLETLTIDTYGRQALPRLEFFAGSCLTNRFALTRFTALKHVDIPFVWVHAALLEAIPRQGGITGVSKNVFPSSLQTLSINSMTSADRAFLDIILDISQCANHFSPRLRVVKIVGNWGKCRDQQVPLIHVARIVVNAGLEMHIGWFNGVVRRTWVAREAGGEGQSKGAERRMEVEVDGRPVESELDWVNSLNLAPRGWSSNTR